MSPVDVSLALGSWSVGRGPLYRRLASALGAAVRRGDLDAGARLPSERELARRLALSRTTVVAAYELLRADGLLESRQGSGTRVACSAGVRVPAAPPARLSSLRPLGAADGVVDCSTSVVRAVDGLPEELFALAAEDVRRAATGLIYEPQGLPELREAIAERYAARGLPTSADEVLITTGAQQAISLLFSLYGRDRGRIVVENPTYAGALDAARAAGAAVAGLPADALGPDPRALRELLGRAPVQLLYLMTACHNPTGSVTSVERRREIVRLAEAAGTTLVDDMTLADLVFKPRGEPPLAAAATTGTIVTIGSLSKLFWPGLRIGWIRAPGPLVGRLAPQKLVADLGSSHVSQLLAVRLVSRSDEVAAVRRRLLAERLALVSDLLRRHLPTWAWSEPQGGPCLWVRLPHGSAEAFGQLALRHGVRVLPGSRITVDDSFANWLRISFALEPAELRVAVERLHQAWSAYEASSDTDRVRLEVVV